MAAVLAMSWWQVIVLAVVRHTMRGFVGYRVVADGAPLILLGNGMVAAT